MKNYFENKISYNQISFHLTDKPTIDEREIHPYNEILLYIEGDVELLSANGQRNLKNSSIITVPEETYHFFKTKENQGFARLKISFPSEIMANTPLTRIMSEMRIVENLRDDLKLIFDKLCQVMATSDPYTPFYAYSAFLMLVSELDKNCVQEETLFQTEPNQIMTSLTNYISANISAELDINSLANVMHISPSGITHLFKKEFGIPIHKYIIQKRLVYAKRLIGEGNQPTKIYADAGFKDYSSFYKAYLNYFGYSPSKENTKNVRPRFI